MPTIKKAAKAVSKKHVRHEIETELEHALHGLKDSLGEKKFKHRIKKAAKLLTHGFSGHIKEEPKIIKKAAKKSAGN